MIDNAIPSVKGISFHSGNIAGYDASKFYEQWQWHSPCSLLDAAILATTKAWSPINWRTDRRLQSDFICADYGALDCDGTYPLEQACLDWSDTISIILTTKSDTSESRRYRILFPWEMRISNLDQFTFNQGLLIDRYDFDAQCADGARFYWPGKEVIQIVEEGYLQPVKEIVEGYSTIEERAAETMRKYEALGDAHIFPPQIKMWLKGQNVDGQRDSSCYYVGKYLTFWGMPENEIIALILSSKLPLNNPRSLKEAERAGKSGIKKAKKIQAYKG